MQISIRHQDYKAMAAKGSISHITEPCLAIGNQRHVCSYTQLCPFAGFSWLEPRLSLVCSWFELGCMKILVSLQQSALLLGLGPH